MIRTFSKLALLCGALLFNSGPAQAGEALVKEGSHVLFVGNSLTGAMDKALLELIAKPNGLPPITVHRIQLWDQTFRTHVLLNKEDYGENFNKELVGYNVLDGKASSGELQRKGGFIVRGHNSLWKEGQYDQPRFNDVGYIKAMDAIELGTPDGKPWDVVVLQGYVDAYDPENALSRDADGKLVVQGQFMVYGKQLVDQAKAAGARVVFYMPWLTDPSKTNSDPLDPTSYYGKQYEKMVWSYRELSKALDVPIVPIGVIAQKLMTTEKPEGIPLNWIYGDGLHPNGVGNSIIARAIGSALWAVPATRLDYQFDPGDDKWRQGKRYVIGQESPAMKDAFKVLITPEVDQGIRKTIEQTMAEYGW